MIVINAEIINDFIKNNNLIKKRFAKECNISTYMLRKIYNYENNIRVGVLYKLAKYLKISANILLVDK